MLTAFIAPSHPSPMLRAMGMGDMMRSGPSHGNERSAPIHRRLLAWAITLAGVGLVVTVLLGAPLVSVFLAGLLLLCPLLVWSPLRSQDRSLDGLDRDRGRR